MLSGLEALLGFRRTFLKFSSLTTRSAIGRSSGPEGCQSDEAYSLVNDDLNSSTCLNFTITVQMAIMLSGWYPPKLCCSEP